jgi:hypothetical protein
MSLHAQLHIPRCDQDPTRNPPVYSEIELEMFPETVAECFINSHYIIYSYIIANLMTLKNFVRIFTFRFTRLALGPISSFKFRVCHQILQFAL